MIHEKIRMIREHLELTVAQVAVLIKTNIYLYRKYEAGKIDVPVETLILLSIAYEIPAAWFLSNEVCPEDVFDKQSIRQLRSVSAKERMDRMRRNLCQSCSYACQRINRRALSDIRDAYLRDFSMRLTEARERKGADVSAVAEVLDLTEEEYCSFENGVSFLLPAQILALADFYQTDVQALIGKTYKNA